ncbi:hypothetical protein ACCO45_011002 [Purpureocillium lilacinum]|uniref:Uncharacterized protein n=1 Tax=Purpureocillium lilacinum TaxID=33203 RepID=A0ACC4DIR0_PURLI
MSSSTLVRRWPPSPVGSAARTSDSPPLLPPPKPAQPIPRLGSRLGASQRATHIRTAPPPPPPSRLQPSTNLPTFLRRPPPAAPALGTRACTAYRDAAGPEKIPTPQPSPAASSRPVPSLPPLPLRRRPLSHSHATPPVFLPTPLPSTAPPRLLLQPIVLNDTPKPGPGFCSPLSRAIVNDKTLLHQSSRGQTDVRTGPFRADSDEQRGDDRGPTRAERPGARQRSVFPPRRAPTRRDLRRD